MPRRRLHWPAAVAALALVVSLPAIADAQLFPNLAIKRERTPCCNEASVYKQYRQQFYGYHPTCWRKFPDGWGCPSAEAPNSASAMEEIRQAIVRMQQPPQENALPGPGALETTPRPGPAPGDAVLPDLPSRERERSPFNLDARPGGTAPPGESGVPPAGGGRPIPPGASMFEGPSTTPVASNAEGPESALALLDVGKPSTPPGSVIETGSDNLPWPAPPATSEPGPSRPSATTAAAAPNYDPAPGMVPQPAQAPQRRGFLSGLFQNWNTRRR